MREIATAAGVTQATVHHYFGSKEDLHEAVVDAMYAEADGLREQFAKLMTTESDPEKLMERVVRVAFRFAREHAGVSKMVLREVLNQGELSEKRRSGHLIPFIEEASQFIAALTGQPRKHVRMTLLSLNFLVIRYSFMSDGELVDFVGGRVRTRSSAEKAVEDHLVNAAKQMLGIGG